METDIQLAVLIDAENVPSDPLKAMIEEIAKYGTPTIKRIYGDWTKPQVTKWKDLLLEHAIIPIQQYSYTSGKNASDSALIIDAMDILYSNKVDGFCIVSSDSDFTRLATRLREAGKKVYGIGEKKTPKAFIAACDRFIYIEILRKPVRKEVPLNSDGLKKGKKWETFIPLESLESETSDAVEKLTPEILHIITESIRDIADEDGWAFLGDVGTLLQKKQPNFDPRNYGYNKLTPLLSSTKLYDIEERKDGKSRYKLIYVRNRSID